MNPNESSGACKCHHHWVAPVSVILVGVAFLLQAFGWMSASVVSVAWPVLLIAYGSTKFCRCCD